jgi:small conductance mechanosensitive channel
MTVGNVIYVILVAIVVTAAAVQLGAKPVNHAATDYHHHTDHNGGYDLSTPLFTIDAVQSGKHGQSRRSFGKGGGHLFSQYQVENLRREDFFVPNRKILDDIVINYHYTQTRRVKINVTIRYDQDLLKAKQLLEAVMTGDPRVKSKPGPAVYVLYLTPNGVDVGGRCWVDNKDYWVARCDLHEKTKLRFDQEGIRFAYPQLDLHLNNQANPFDKEDFGTFKEYKETADNEPHNELET